VIRHNNFHFPASAAADGAKLQMLDGSAGGGGAVVRLLAAAAVAGL
jgi:hypothetical protein